MIKLNTSITSSPDGARRSAVEASLVAVLTGDVVVHAEQYAHGRRCLRIVHGPLLTPLQQEARSRALELAPGAAVALGGSREQYLAAVFSTGETVFWWTSSPRAPADHVVDDFADRLAGLCPSSWRFSTNPSNPG